MIPEVPGVVEVSLPLSSIRSSHRHSSEDLLSRIDIRKAAYGAAVLQRGWEKAWALLDTHLLSPPTGFSKKIREVFAADDVIEESSLLHHSECGLELPSRMTQKMQDVMRLGDGHRLFLVNTEMTQRQANDLLGELESVVYGTDVRLKKENRQVVDSLTDNEIRAVKDKLMLIRALSFNLHEFFEKPAGYHLPPNHQSLHAERREFARMIGGAVAGSVQEINQRKLFTVGAAVFAEAHVHDRLSHRVAYEDLIESGYRLGFVVHVLAISRFCYTTPGFNALRGELYRSLADLAKFLRPASALPKQ